MKAIPIFEVDDPPALRPETIHVWRIALDLPPDALARFRESLSADEQARADRFRFETHRDHFVAGRGALRAILSRYVGIAPDQLAFTYGPQGKPALSNAGDGLEFNLTHSHGLALLALGPGGRIGIDLEQLRPMDDAERIAERFFSARERDALRAIPAEGKVEAFLRCWTRKEAFIKAIGEGFSMPLDRFDVSLDPGAGARLLSVADRPDEAARWTLIELDLAPGFLAAVAIQGPCREIQLIRT
jgi:4'-phosphopantetheinyl transferase